MTLKQKIFEFFRKYWVVFVLVFIVILGTEVRLIDYRWPYLRNIDSYNFASQIEDTVKLGYLPAYDQYKLAPDGMQRNPYDPYIYIGYYSYEFFRLFLPSLQLYDYLIWFPALLASLAAIPMYFIGKKLYDKRAGILAAAFIVFDTAMMARTLGGDPDSDGIVLLMPLIVIALFIYTYKLSLNRKFDKKLVFLAILTGLAAGVWRYAWGGYWFVLWLITGFIILKIIFDAMRLKDIRMLISEDKHTVLSYVIIIIFFLLVTIPYYGPTGIVSTITGPIEFPTIKSETGQFPNVYVSVAELQSPGDFRQIINQVGMPFFILIFSLFYLVYSYIRRRQHLDTMILLGIWFLGPFLATFVAVRFTILFSAPIAIGSGIIFAKIIRMATGEDRSIED